MLQEGDRLTELMMEKERLEEELAEGFDDVRQMEIEAMLEDIVVESESITQTLDTLDEHLQIVSEKVARLENEVREFDWEQITPPRFKGLSSVENARATLRTFFLVMLDLNVYKRELENKCID